MNAKNSSVSCALSLLCLVGCAAERAPNRAAPASTMNARPPSSPAVRAPFSSIDETQLSGRIGHVSLDGPATGTELIIDDTLTSVRMFEERSETVSLLQLSARSSLLDEDGIHDVAFDLERGPSIFVVGCVGTSRTDMSAYDAPAESGTVEVTHTTDDAVHVDVNVEFPVFDPVTAEITELLPLHGSYDLRR
jgi:hypothetical protein